MKKFLLFCLFSGSASFVFAADNFSGGEINTIEAMKTEVEAILVEPACVPTTFSCGVSSNVCGSDMAEILEVIEYAEEYYCG